MNIFSRVRNALRRPDPTDVDEREFRAALADEARRNQAIDQAFDRAYRPTQFTRRLKTLR